MPDNPRLQAVVDVWLCFLKQLHRGILVYACQMEIADARIFDHVGSGTRFA